MRAVTALFLATFLVPGAVSAQEHHQPHREGLAGLTFEFHKPNYDEDFEESLLSGAYYLSGWHQLGPGSLFFRLPWAHVSVDTGLEAVDETFNGSAFGNPQLGYTLERGNLTWQASVHLPFGSEDEFATFFVIPADITRIESWAPDLTAIRVGVEAELPLAPGVHLLLEGVPALWLLGGETEVGEEEGDDTELVLHHAAGVGYESAMVRASGRFEGSTLLTEDTDDRTELQLGLGVDVGRGALRPGVSLRLPLTKTLREHAGPSLGVSLTWLVH